MDDVEGETVTGDLIVDFSAAIAAAERRGEQRAEEKLAEAREAIRATNRFWIGTVAPHWEWLRLVRAFLASAQDAPKE